VAGTSLQALTLLQKSSEELKLKKMWHETLDSMPLGRILASVFWGFGFGGYGWSKESVRRILWGEEWARKRYFEG